MTPADDWRRNAEALAEWAWLRLVNRTDAWGQYVPLERRTDPTMTTFTAPPTKRRGLDFLTGDVLVRHFRGDICIGLQSTGPENTSRWGSKDIDVHEQTPELCQQASRRIARLVAAYRERRIEPLVEDACGRGGAHLWIIFDAPVPTPDVFAFLQDVRQAAGVDCETFPKQSRLTAGGYGNWLRIPGKHHSRDHWSRIAEGGKWRSGAAATRALLDHPLTPASLIPPAPSEPAKPLSWPSRDTTLTPRPVDRRITRYLDRLPSGLNAGERRSDVAFSFGKFLAVELGLSDADALGWLAEWNRRNATPLPDAKLVTTLANVHRYCSRGAA